jgi:hypothetical protein
MKRNLMILTFLCLGLLIHPTASAALKDGLVAYWPVDGNLADESGNGHNGTALNGGAALSYVPGKFGQAANFSGAWGGGVDTGTWSPNVHNGPFSMACWARWQAGGQSQWQGLIGKRDQWSGTADTPEANNMRMYWYIEFSHDAASPAANQKTRDLYFQSNRGGPWQTAKTLISNQWQYVVATFDGTNAVLYLDGQRIAGEPLYLDERDFNNHIVFGAVGYNGSSNIENAYCGAMDEVAIWNRTLTPAEVTELYNNGDGTILGGNQWKATNPVPADGAKLIPADADLTLQWSAPTVAAPKPITMYDVYFGTDKAAVTDANGISPLKLGTVAATSDLKWIIAKANLQRDKTYYWRVDAMPDRNDPNIAFGKVWSFETKKSIPVILTNPTDQLVEFGGTASFTIKVESPSAYTVKWYREDAPTTVVGTGDTLTVTNAQLSHFGKKYCAVATNPAGDSLPSGGAAIFMRTLVAHYACDDTIDANNKVVVDSSGLSRNGTAMSTTASVPGIIGGGLAFNGSTDFVNCGKWNPTEVTGQMTVSFWSKWGGSTGSWQGFIGKRDTWGAASMMWNINCHAQNEGRVGIDSDGSGPWFGPTEVRVLPVDQWAHVAVTFDGSLAAIFINGHRVWDPQPFTMNGKTDAALVFGATDPGPADAYKGVLDDVRIYNYVLTPTEIGSMVAEVLGKPVCPVYHPYDFNQDCKVNLPDLMILLSNWMQCNIVPECL